MFAARSLRLSRPASRGLAQLNALRGSNALVDVHAEVQDALAHNQPVVALETALVTHGLPYPQSLEVPLSMEDIVRSTGAIPATIGIIEGRVKIGMEKHEVDRLASRAAKKSVKVSRRDIAAAIATGVDGGTTIGGTLVFAALAGIKVFATGGLGGVHRGGENSLDISADLHELSRSPVAVVSSGVKSILDIKRTLEYLETQGVPVISYGKSPEFPAFFSRHSGHNVPWNMDNPLAVAKFIYAQHQLGMQNGALIAVPIPEEYEAVGEEIQQLVNQAVKESEENGISQSGNDATPWLLGRIAELSGGRSLVSNTALLENTALVGGQIAVKYQNLVNEALYNSDDKAVGRSWSQKYRPKQDSHIITPAEQQSKFVSHPSSANVVVVGCAAVDITAQELHNTNTALARHSTAPGHVKLSLGGVGRNIAEAAHRIMEAKFPSLSSLLLAPIGRDAFGKVISEGLNDLGMRTDGLLKLDYETAVCNMVLDSEGSLVGGIADMAVNAKMTAEIVIPHLTKHVPSLVTMDGNLPPATLNALVAYCNEHRIHSLFEPTSIIKSTAILPAVLAALSEEDVKSPVTFCTPNLLELSQLYEAARSDEYGLMDHPTWWTAIDSLNLGSAFRMDLEQLSRRPVSDHLSSGKTLSFLIDQGIAQKAVHLLPFFQHLVIKCGDQGVLVLMHIPPEDAHISGWKQERSSPRQRYVVAAGKSGGIVVLQHFPSHPVPCLVNVTGAGDSFVGALLAVLANSPGALYNPKTLDEAVSTAQKAAVLTLQSHAAVSPLLSELDKA